MHRSHRLLDVVLHTHACIPTQGKLACWPQIRNSAHGRGEANHHYFGYLRPTSSSRTSLRFDAVVQHPTIHPSIHLLQTQYTAQQASERYAHPPTNQRTNQRTTQPLLSRKPKCPPSSHNKQNTPTTRNLAVTVSNPAMRFGGGEAGNPKSHN